VGSIATRRNLRFLLVLLVGGFEKPRRKEDGVFDFVMPDRAEQKEDGVFDFVMPDRAEQKEDGVFDF